MVGPIRPKNRGATNLGDIVDVVLVLGVDRAAAGGPGAHPHSVPEVRVQRGVSHPEDPRGFVAQALRKREVEELFPQALVPTVPASDEEEDHHGEKVEHHEEPGADPDGEVLALRQVLSASRSLRFTNFS